MFAIDDDRHALVMRHEIADDRNVLVVGQPRAGEVERFVEAIAAKRTHRGELRVVLARCLRIDHRGQSRRIRRDHAVLRETALEAESGHAEIRVLVGEFDVAGVIRRLRNAPRNAKRLAVRRLPFHHQTARLFEQAADRRAHDQRRHQVFEHRSRPGNQRRAVADRRRGTAEAEPVARRHVAFRDREQAREPRFRRQQVVAVRVEAVVGQRIADRQQLAFRIEQEREVHAERHRARPLGERPQAILQKMRRIGELLRGRGHVRPRSCSMHRSRTSGRRTCRRRSRARCRASSWRPFPSGASTMATPLRASAARAVARRSRRRSRQAARRARRPRRAARRRPRARVAGRPSSRAGQRVRAMRAATRRMRWRERSDDRPDCRYRPRTHRPAPAPADPASRTSCRNVR